MGFNPDMHHRRSIRLQEYDYSQNGYYFVTICTKHFIKYLGEIKNGKTELSKIGEIVKQCWGEIPRHFDNVTLDEMVIMPNHVHGIVVIDNNGIGHVGACHGMPLQQYGMPLQQFGNPQSKSLSMIVNHFKSAVKRWCNKNNFPYFQWQRNYHERIIRNEIELYIKRRYIINNPVKWKFDKNNFI